MRRLPYGPIRDGWRLTNYSLGLTYNDTELPDGTMISYWQEGPYYDFTQDEIEELETATELDPNYADAHFNLAVVFGTQSPPNKDEARKHYKRAIELGAEPDTALEQLIK